MTNNMMTIEEMCFCLSIGKTSAYKLAKTMRSVKIGKRVMVPKADVDAYIMKLIKEREERMKEREKHFKKYK